MSFKTPSSGETFTANGSVMDAYEAVCRVVANEMPASFEKEALKAQAVATYTLFKSGGGSATGVGLVSSMSKVDNRIKNAVSEVFGEAVKYKGQYIQVFYCSMTAGTTNKSNEVWTLDLPYYKNLDSKWDKSVSGYKTEKTLAKSTVIAEVKAKLGIELDINDSASWFEVVSYTGGGYNDKMKVGGYSVAPGGTYKGKAITGRLLRENVFGLRSACFEWRQSGNSIVFTTYGYGHGVGMSQYGANGMAKEGKNYLDILKYYYQGVTVGK